MNPRLVVLGAGTIVPRPGYGPSGYAIEAAPNEPLTLLDCGPGSLRTMATVGLDPARVERVVFSHFHPDHLLDLFALALFRRLPEYAESVPDLELIGPSGLRAVVDAAPDAIGRAVSFSRTEVREVSLDSDSRGRLAAGPFDLACTSTGHSPEALAWRLEAPWMGPLSYTGDCPFEPRVAELARGSDLFVLECSFPDGAGTANHLTPSQAADLVRLAGPGRALLTHFYPSADPAACAAIVSEKADCEVLAARDGLSLSLARSS